MSDGSWIRLNVGDIHLMARDINPIIREIVGKKVPSITQNPKLRALISTYYINAVTPYIPMKTGTLRRSGNATADGRIYWTATSPRGYNYAAVQYYTQFGHYTTPGTGPYWDEKVQPGTPDYATFIEKIIPYIIEEFK